MTRYIIYAVDSKFGQTSPTTFGFINTAYLLINKTRNGKKREEFSADAARGILYSDTESLRTFRTHESAKNWLNNHEITIDGKKARMVIREMKYWKG